MPVEALEAVLPNGDLVAAAFDADVVAWRVAQQVPVIKQLTPNQEKDWNEVPNPDRVGNAWGQKHLELSNSGDGLG